MAYEPGSEIAEAAALANVNDAKNFAAGWIDTAAQYARDVEYWKTLARRREDQIADAISELNNAENDYPLHVSDAIDILLEE
jgi:hypothetical protein